MCGIAGAIDLNAKRRFPARRLLAMTAALAHRGPDDEHIHIEDGVALGARRLSIVDLPNGRQPIANESGDVWVAFNGELFDYPSIRKDLLARGHRLKTHCDTEAWVHLYESYGVDMLSHVKGQFAFSLWDRTRRTLILGRDRVGICPLFYTEADGWLLWGSEIKALLASRLITARPDVRGIDHLFTFFAAGTERTCFAGVKSIPPGHYLRVRDGRVERHQYWDLDFPDAGEERRCDDPDALRDELEDSLRQAVKRRLRCDVPVVTYLSGGLDSTVVLGLSSQDRAEPIRSFTIGLERAGPDESAQAGESAGLLGSPLTTVSMGLGDIAQAYPDLIRASEAPVMDTSCGCMMRLAESVHEQGFKVALTGEGADEALAGYIWFKSQMIGRRFARHFGWWLPNLVHRATLAWVGGGSAHRPSPTAMGGVRPVQAEVAEVFAQARELYYTPDMWARLDGHSAFDDLNFTNDRISRWHPLNQSIYAAYKIMLPGLLLQAKGDRVAMNSSVETRYPFLDEHVVEFCAQLAPKYKVRGLTDKWLLRRVAKKVLPPAIAKRPKTMFRAAQSRVFLGPARPPWVDQLLSREALCTTGYFEPAMIERIRAMQERGLCITPRRAVTTIGVTGVIATQLWHHTFCGGGLCDLPHWTPPDAGVSEQNTERSAGEVAVS